MIERSRSTPLPGLAAHRRRRGLTQRQLGELAGVAHTTVQQLESLKRGAYPQTLRKLATALRVEPKDWTCVGSVDCFRLRTVRGKESSTTNKLGLPTAVSPRSYPATLPVVLRTSPTPLLYPAWSLS